MSAKSSRSRAFFLELVLDLVVFMLCAVVVLQVFIDARATSSVGAALTHLSVKAQDIAAIYQDCEGDPDALLQAIGRDVEPVVESGQLLLVYGFNDEFDPVDVAHARYTVTVLVPTAGPVREAVIGLTADGRLVHEFKVTTLCSSDTQFLGLPDSTGIPSVSELTDPSRGGA
ncbi:MAG: hypothetical protein LBD25_08055 [Coriobacteriales bacterium]|jgi:hypothetical protein|nr:hypothetical protein [Coriobacteriales bacterium]